MPSTSQRAAAGRRHRLESLQLGVGLLEEVHAHQGADVELVPRPQVILVDRGSHCPQGGHRIDDPLVLARAPATSASAIFAIAIVKRLFAVSAAALAWPSAESHSPRPASGQVALAWSDDSERRNSGRPVLAVSRPEAAAKLPPTLFKMRVHPYDFDGAPGTEGLEAALAAFLG